MKTNTGNHSKTFDPIKNENCLEGIRCPECGVEEAFNMVVEAEAKLLDDGVDGFSGDTSWGDDSPITCIACQHHGVVADFTIENWPISVKHPLVVGESVYFDDPDTLADAESTSSGWYEIVATQAPDEKYENTLISLKNGAGSELDVYAWELSRKLPSDVGPADLETYTVFCQQSNGKGTIWISTVDVAPCDDPDETLEKVKASAIQLCACDWYGSDEMDADPSLMDGIVCMGVAEGDVSIHHWDDSHIENG